MGKSARQVEYDKLQKKLKELYAETTSINERMREIESSRMLACTWCKKKSAVRNWGKRRRHWYVEPYSCTAGDYWTFSEEVVCPKCEHSHCVEEYSYDDESRKKQKKMYRDLTTLMKRIEDRGKD